MTVARFIERQEQAAPSDMPLLENFKDLAMLREEKATIGALVLAALVVVQTIGCLVSDEAMGSCMKAGAHSGAAVILYIGNGAASCWIGVQIARLSRRTWLGWIAGLILFFAVSFLLLYFGFHWPKGSAFTDE